MYVARRDYWHVHPLILSALSKARHTNDYDRYAIANVRMFT